MRECEKIDYIQSPAVIAQVDKPREVILFNEGITSIKSSFYPLIKEGRLQQVSQKGVEINMPEIFSDKKDFYQEIFASWKSLHEHVLSEQGTYRNFKNSRIKQAIYKGFFSLLIPIALRVKYKKKGNYFYGNKAFNWEHTITN